MSEQTRIDTGDEDPETSRLTPLDLGALSLEDIDSMEQAVLREAVRSVMRNPDTVRMHRDHRSHSSSVDREEEVAKPEIQS